MTIKELIKELENLQKQYGNIEVRIFDELTCEEYGSYVSSTEGFYPEPEPTFYKLFKDEKDDSLPEQFIILNGEGAYDMDR